MAIASGVDGPGSDIIGDWISGRGGDDILIGDAGNDVIFGGAGNNTIVGGAGDDHIYGDEDASSGLAQGVGGFSGSVEVPSEFHFQWTFRQSSVLRNERRQEVPTNASDPFTPEGWGNNAIYVGAGNDWVSGGFGDDYIDGGDGNDILNGDDGWNVIIGGAGNDTITSGLFGIHSGGYIDAGDGDDRIVAVNGNYFIDAGAGDDEIEGDQFNPESGSYSIYAGDGDDTIRGSYGDDYIEAGDGADTVFGAGGNDYVLGGAGDDYLESMAGAAKLFGEEGNDVLSVVVTGTGTVLDGGVGDDEYDLFLGSGDVTIRDAAGSNHIVIISVDEVEPEDGIATSSIRIEWTGAELALLYGESGDRIRLADDANLPSLYIRHVTEYIDGRWIGDDELISMNSLSVYQSGSVDADYIEGRPDSANNLFGNAGDDYIVGAAANDTLSGGPGDDILDGGAGGDLYLFSAGDGHDTIADSGTSPSDINLLRFGEGIAASDLSVFQTYDDILLNVGPEDSGDSVTITGAAGRDVIARVEFFDGTVWDAAALRSIAVLVSPPELEDPVDPPPNDGSGATEIDPQPTPEPSAIESAAPTVSDDNSGPVISAPLFNILLPPTIVGNSFDTELSAPLFEPEPSGTSFGSIAAAMVSFGNGGPANVIGAGPVIAQPSDFSSVAATGGSVGRGGSAQTASTGDSRIDQSDRSDLLTTRMRDTGAIPSSSEPSNAEGSSVLGDEPDFVAQSTHREADPGGLSWLAQQSDTPRDSAPALTQWAVANALMQFRLGSSDESTGMNASAGFVGSLATGLPSLSDIAPLGMGTPGLRGEGTSLQSFSGLSEGLVALAA